MTDHLVSLPGTGWTVWRDAVLRSAGFPAAGLDRLTAPDCAAVADAFLDGRASRAEAEAALAAELERARAVVEEIAADPLFREALIWQNPAAAARVTRLDSHRRRGYRIKYRENTIARYWQRYCGKNDTIGFFGPVTWALLDPLAPGADVRAGGGLVRARTTYFEYWALQAFADRLAADPVVRPWLPVGLEPHVAVVGDRVLMPGREPLPLTPEESALLARCDGRPAVRAAGADLAVLDGLAGRGVLRWGVSMPQDLDAERVLRATLTGIADPAARERALSWLRRLDAARAAVNAARGDPDRLAAAMNQLDAEFTEITGAAAERSQGQMYAGRKLCYEETVRDVDVTFGGPVLDALAGPFGSVVLPAARWLSVALAGAYADAFRRLYADLGGSRGAGVPLDRFWAAAMPLITSVEPVSGKVAADLTDRWSRLLGLDDLPPGTSQVTLSSADLAATAARLFAAPGPAWAGARIHSPDLQICATSAEAISRGEFTIVLGELHAMWPTLDCAMFIEQHCDRDRLRAAAVADIGAQVLPLYANWCPQFTPRGASNLCDDYQLSFTAEPGTDPARLLRPMTITVIEGDDGTLVAAAADGRRWPLFEMFAVPISWFCTELFKLTTPSPHTPRITIDRLVVSRQTWRTTVGQAWLADAGGLPEYLAARRLRRTLGLPDKVFAKIGTEVKPVYLDLTSPRYVSAFATMLRAARQNGGEHTTVVMTELLPGPDQAWLPGPDGQGYFSELRMHMVDPVPAGPIERGGER